jgi:hypothetical protein
LTDISLLFDGDHLELNFYNARLEEAKEDRKFPLNASRIHQITYTPIVSDFLFQKTDIETSYYTPCMWEEPALGLSYGSHLFSCHSHSTMEIRP